MIAEQEQRLEAFEKMLRAVEENYETADQKMKKLKAEGREKSATYRQLMGNKDAVSEHAVHVSDLWAAVELFRTK